MRRSDVPSELFSCLGGVLYQWGPPSRNVRLIRSYLVGDTYTAEQGPLKRSAATMKASSSPSLIRLIYLDKSLRQTKKAATTDTATAVALTDERARVPGNNDILSISGCSITVLTLIHETHLQTPGRDKVGIIMKQLGMGQGLSVTSKAVLWQYARWEQPLNVVPKFDP
ncbi:hypothetical protein CISG_03394 [Coccidioides immitis RMSCC 3703]|uniref:Uncharacterized protein n=1 Tax=Coccidioides immitis RMSCC 3703 TaxID=454286 RepID=A0A0J8QPB7_COCIT|nr:hypothetical protein CISG_03394 [Coccidioides immitis RMSCC 3703]